MNDIHNNAIAYRPEIDGLRAVAVLPVIFFHAGFDWFSGGFIGVDVFFVISGYLITSIILSEMGRENFSIVRFYERRARRILPALFFVIVCCLPFAWAWMLPEELKRFGQSLVGVAVFSSNVYFWRNTDYFAPAAEEQPLLHTWSLAVEEQYYVLFPLFLLLCWRLGRSRIFWLTSLIALLSFALADWASKNHSAANFYLLPTRAWELLAGSLLAFVPLNYSAKLREGKFSQFGSALGISLIGVAIFGLNGDAPFPGVYALLPVLGAVLVIACASSKNFCGKLLSSKAFVGIGLISYSAYLWHQPIFSFIRIHQMGKPPQILFAAGTMLSILLAWLSWKFVEAPFRRPFSTRRLVFSWSAIGLASMVSLGASAHALKGFESRFELLDDAVVSTFQRANAACFDKPVDPTGPVFCSISDDEKASRANYIVLGDSHMYSALPAFRKIESDKLSFFGAGAYVGYSGCPAFIGVHAVRGDQETKNCKQLNDRILDEAARMGVKDVFLLGRWTYYTDGGYTGNEFSFISSAPADAGSKENSRQAFVAGLEQTVSEWSRRGIAVWVIGQIPQQKMDPRNIYYLAGAKEDPAVIKQLSVSSAEHAGLQQWVRSQFESVATANPRFRFIDPAVFMCEEKCPVGTVANSWYFDDDHLSIRGAERLSTYLAKSVASMHATMDR